MKQRILFLCARGSSRSVMAASILSVRAADEWDAWSTPSPNGQGLYLAERVLYEQSIPLIASDHLIQPTWGLHWDEGIILCSGTADT